MNAGTAIALAAVAGLVLPLQILLNARLGVALGNAPWATTVSFIVGTIGLLSWVYLTRSASATWGEAASQPWWIWVGGLLGAFYVATTIITAPVIGATALVLLVILGQMVASAALDHFGILTDQRPVTLLRLLGLVLVMAGTWLAVRH